MPFGKAKMSFKLPYLILLKNPKSNLNLQIQSFYHCSQDLGANKMKAPADSVYVQLVASDSKSLYGQVDLQVDAATIASARGTVVSTPGLYDGLSVAAQKATQTGNFTQALGSSTASLTTASQPLTLATAG